MPEAVFVQEGQYIDYTPGGDLAAGQVVDLGTWAGVAQRAITANTLGALLVEGVCDFTKYTAEAINFGVTVYWDEGTNTATATQAYSECIIGKCIKAAGSGDATVRVKMMPAMGA